MAAPACHRVSRFQGDTQGDGLVDKSHCGRRRPLPTKRLERTFHCFHGAERHRPRRLRTFCGAGSNAWFGWPDVPQLEKLGTDWVRTTDHTKRKQLADEIQKVALDEVTYVPWGEWVQPTVFRKNVKDVLKFGAPIFWNVKLG